jgi:alpha-mannosidase
LTHFPPADTYNSNGSLEEVLKSHTNLKDKGRTNTSLMLFGDGDGGGGPQLEHLERLERLQDFEGAPKVKFSTCHEFFRELDATSKNLMKWEGELYLELHNGTYTSVAEIKNYCRRMEIMLRDVEIFSSIAHLNNPDFTYRLSEITDMWHTFLIDQFHDVLPGTCIGLTYEDTRKNFKELTERSLVIIKDALTSVLELHLGDQYSKLSFRQLRPQIDDFKLNSNECMVLFNSLTIDRFERIQCEGASVTEGQVLVPKMGMAFVNQKHLEHSMSTQALSFREVNGGF